MINNFSDYIQENLKVKKFRKDAEKKTSSTAGAGGGYQAVRDIISKGKTDIELNEYDVDIDKRLGKSKSQRKVAYNDLKRVIPTIADALGIDAGDISYAGGGSYGITFTVDGKVIKSHTDEWEARTAHSLMGHEYSHLIKYYDVKRLDGLDVYVILMDKVKILDKEDRKIASSIVDEYGENISEFLENYENVDIGELDRQGYKKPYVDILNQLAIIFKELEKVGIMDDYTDVHVNNLGWKGNTLMHYDIRGVSEAPAVEEIINLSEV